MKKLFTLLCITAVILSAQAENIRFTYNIDNLQVSVKNGYQTVSFDNMLLTGKAGEPSLPYYAVKLMLPPGHEAVSIDFSGSDKVNLNGYYKLYPAQPSRPVSSENEGTFMLNEQVYNSSAKYPAQPTGTLTTHFMNGHSYALCTFTPIEYNPLQGSLSYYQSVTITVVSRATSRGAIALENLSSNEMINERCKTFAQNTDLSSSYGYTARTVDSYDVLIITPNMFAEQADTLVDHYHLQGLKSKIITMQEILAEYTGIDAAEKTRNCIKQEYQTNGISQVILAGDAEIVPYRGFFCSVQSVSVYEDTNIPSDLYYSALDGNWNTNNNSLWGEIGEDDLLPEISVGRMPFSNASEFAAMINKTIMYQNHPVEGELNNHLLAGENLYYNPDTWGSDYLELLIGTVTADGYTTTGFPASYPVVKLYDEISYWSPEDIINAINAGRSFVSHSGHSNEYYTMKLYDSDITNQNFYAVNGTTHNFPVLYSHGCICGAFDYNDCIGERMVGINNFASAFVANSRYGWFNEGQTEGPSHHLHREFMDALFADSLNRIGSAHLESRIATAPWVNAPGQWEEGALRWCFYDCNVLGDPAMAVWTNEPLDIVTTYPATIATGSSSFEVTVINQGNPAKGLKVAAIKNDVLIGSGYTGANGVAVVPLDSTINMAGPAQIVVSGYNCKPTVYNTVFSIENSINEQTATALTIYPNPASDRITIINELDNPFSKLSLHDITGKQIREFIITNGVSPQSIELNGLEPGIYFLRYTDSTSANATKIIIK